MQQSETEYTGIVLLETVIKSMSLIQDPLQMRIQFIMNALTHSSLFEMKHNHIICVHCNNGFPIQPMHLNVVCS